MHAFISFFLFVSQAGGSSSSTFDSEPSGSDATPASSSGASVSVVYLDLFMRSSLSSSVLTRRCISIEGLFAMDDRRNTPSTLLLWLFIRGCLYTKVL